MAKIHGRGTSTLPIYSSIIHYHGKRNAFFKIKLIFMVKNYNILRLFHSFFINQFFLEE